MMVNDAFLLPNIKLLEHGAQLTTKERLTLRIIRGELYEDNLREALLNNFRDIGYEFEDPK